MGCEENSSLAKPTCEKKPWKRIFKPRLVGRDARCSVSKTNLDKKDQVAPSLLKDEVSFESDCDAAEGGLSVFRCSSVNLATDDNAEHAMQTDVNEHFDTEMSSKDEQLHSTPVDTKGLKINPDTSLPVDEMFYLPKWDVCQKLNNCTQSAGSLATILSNVKHLLSRSPPECLDLHCSLSLNEPAHFKEICSSPKEDVDFQVNFDLDEDMNSLDSDSLDCNIAGALSECVVLPRETVSAGLDSTANSPSWDEVFDDVEDDKVSDKTTDLPLEPKIPHASLDESIELFDDDEAFLQISLPNIQTPNKDTVIPNRQDTDPTERLTQNVKDASHAEETSRSPVLLGHKPPLEQRAETFNYSQDIFSVNFDLGFSSESEEEETAEPASDLTKELKVDSKQTNISLTLNKPNMSTNNFTLGHMSTPRVCPMDKKLPSLIAKSNLSPIITERESLRPTLTSAFVSPKSRNLELFPKVLSSKAHQCGTESRLCRRSLLNVHKPVYEAHSWSGTFLKVKFGGDMWYICFRLYLFYCFFVHFELFRKGEQ